VVACLLTPLFAYVTFDMMNPFLVYAKTKAALVHGPLEPRFEGICY
jgi:hypothetical protein